MITVKWNFVAFNRIYCCAAVPQAKEMLAYQWMYDMMLKTDTVEKVLGPSQFLGQGVSLTGRDNNTSNAVTGGVKRKAEVSQEHGASWDVVKSTAGIVKPTRTCCDRLCRDFITCYALPFLAGMTTAKLHCGVFSKH